MDWRFSLSTIPLGLMQVVVWIDSLFLFIAKEYFIIWMYHGFSCLFYYLNIYINIFLFIFLNFIVIHFPFKSMIHFELIFYSVSFMLRFFSPQFQYTCFSAICRKGCITSCIAFVPLSKIIWTYLCGSIFEFSVVLLIYVSVSLPMWYSPSTYLLFSSYIVYLNIR